MKEKVVFDTNFLYNKRGTSFFGNKEELERFAVEADIIVPEIVIEELEAKYFRSFEQEKEKFFKTILPNMIVHNTNDVVIQTKLKDLIEAESIVYETIQLTDFRVLPLMKDLAIGKLAPFEPSDGTDKGFKDTYIYFTILEYLQGIPDKYVFVCVKDKRFKTAFEGHHNIIPIESYNEFKQHSVSQFRSDYFIGKVNAQLDLTITKENIIEYWHNIYDNQNVLVSFGDVEYVLETDSKEIVGSVKKDEFEGLIPLLVNSGSFPTTHSAIEELTPFINYLSNEEIIAILNASCTNQQIQWIIDDDDVKQFIGTLYEATKELIEDEEVAAFLKETFD